MKRTGRKSLITGILALSLVLAGTGYAYWTDTLKLDVKATTGDFGVQFVDLGLYAQYGDEICSECTWSIIDGIGDDGYHKANAFMRGMNDFNIIAKDGSIKQYKQRAAGYNNVEFDAKLIEPKAVTREVGPYTSANTNGSDKIELSIKKMYPGYAQTFRTNIINVGDIAAKLSNIKFSLSNEDTGNLDKMLGVAIYIANEEYANKTSVAPVFKLADTLKKDGNFFTVGGVNFIRLSALQDAEVMNALQNNLILTSPGGDNRMDMFLAVAMDPDSDGVYTTGSTSNMKDNSDSMSQNKSIDLIIDLLWDQFNAGKNNNNIKGNILANQN